MVVFVVSLSNGIVVLILMQLRYKKMICVIWIFRCSIATFPFSSKSSSFQLRGNDRAWNKPISRPRRDRKPKSDDDFYYY